MTYTEFLSWVFLVLLLMSYFSVSLRRDIQNTKKNKYKDKLKWVKRKSKLLEAMLEDYNQLTKTEEEVESRARSFWDIEDLSQIHHHLSEDEKKWVASTKVVVNEAQRCCRKYAKQRPLSILGDITYIYGWMSTKGVLQKLSPRSILGHIASISRWITTKGVLHKLSPRLLLGGIASISISIWMTTKGVRHKPIPQSTLDEIASISRRMAIKGVLHKPIPQATLDHLASISRRMATKGVLHKLSPQSIWVHIISIFAWMTAKDVLDRKIDDVESKLTDHFKKKDEQAKDIHMSMEESRSKARSLLDQYTTEERHISKAGKLHNLDQNQKQKKPSTSFDELIKMSMEMDLFSGMEERWSIYLLLPLHGFLKDLNQLQLETETEKCWKTVAEEIIKDAEINLSNYIWWFQTFGRFKKFKDIPFVTNPFREKMKVIVTEFDKLIKYNLTFINRAEEKSTFSYNTHHIKFTSAIRSKLGFPEAIPEQVVKVRSMCDDLDKMLDQLKEAEAAAGRNACIKQLKAMVEELNKFHVNSPKFNQIEIKNAIVLLQHLTNTCIIQYQRQDSTNVVGLKIKEQDLILNLTAASSDNASKICIMGMKGVGKTTLAKTVYYNKVVVNHFPTRVWITVIAAGANKRTQVLLTKNRTKDQTLTVKQVSAHLKNRLCLVVLDNVSKPNDFDGLCKQLCVSRWKSGSRMVVTTCFKDVASRVNRSSTLHRIPLLTKEESWALFQKVAANAIEKQKSKKKLNQQDMETFAKKVAGKCGGLPLAILYLGFAISAKGIAQKSFLWVLEQFNHGRYKTHWLTAWKNNEKTMSDSMKNCLYYLTNFPLDCEISARRLVNLWVGEGLVQQNNQKTPEETAESYLKELRDRCMIQVVARKSNGEIKTCCLPSMLREVMLQNSKRTNHSQYFDTHLDQRFAYNFDDHGLDAAIKNKGIPVSVLFFDKQEGREPGKRVGNILSTGIASEQFLKTRVLDLECIFRPRLPKTLSELNNLKYLSLRWTYLEELPRCICKLQELETPDLKHTCINYIPSSIWELKNLKKLYLPQNLRSKLEVKPRENVNKTLHTLWGVFLYGNYPLLGYLQNLKNLQKLKLAFQFNKSEQKLQETLAHKIVQLEQLHSLTLKSVDESGDPEKLILTDMLKLKKLSSLRLFGQLEDTFHVRFLPKNLTDLTLSASKLSVDPMPELQLMPKLKSLCFYADSYIEKKMVCASGGFRELKVLRFWNLEKLEELDVIEGAMPKLEEFEVRSCKELKVPTGLDHLKTIRIIKLRTMLTRFGKQTQSLVDEKMPLVIVECDEMITNQGSQPSVSN